MADDIDAKIWRVRLGSDGAVEEVSHEAPADDPAWIDVAPEIAAMLAAKPGAMRRNRAGEWVERSWWMRVSPTDGTNLAYSETEPEDLTHWVPIPVKCDLVKKLGQYCFDAARGAWLPRGGIPTTSQKLIALERLTPTILCLLIQQWAKNPNAGPPPAAVEWATEFLQGLDGEVLRINPSPRLADLRKGG